MYNSSCRVYLFGRHVIYCSNPRKLVLPLISNYRRARLKSVFNQRMNT